MIENNRLPAVYIPHGGGPWHVMKDSFGSNSGYDDLEAYLVDMGARYHGRIKSILMVSAHWEESRPTVHHGSNPGMLYDYGGFPEYTYDLKWPAPGDPALATRVDMLLRTAGFETRAELERGYDHGTFVPMMVAFPRADIPVVQLSLVTGLDPATHFAMGRALEPLRDEGVLIIGSGMSYHNMRGFMSGDPDVLAASRHFDDWLAQTVAMTDPEQRRHALLHWKQAPDALACHPRSEHLVPLFIAAGAAGSDPGRRDYSGMLLGVQVSSLVFGS